MLERTLDEIARNDQIMSGGEKAFGSLEPEQLHVLCANSLKGWRAGGSHHNVGSQTVSKIVEHQLVE